MNHAFLQVGLSIARIRVINCSEDRKRRSREHTALVCACAVCRQGGRHLDDTFQSQRTSHPSECFFSRSLGVRVAAAWNPTNSYFQSPLTGRDVCGVCDIYTPYPFQTRLARRSRNADTRYMHFSYPYATCIFWKKNWISEIVYM